MAAKEDNIYLCLSQINAGDMIYDLCCTPCSIKNLNKEASKYCVNCGEYFCVQCVESHNSFKALSEHVLADPTDTKSSSSSSGRTIHALPTELCRIHKLKLIDMYCGNHDSVGCSVCITLDHKSCDDIHYIPEYVKSSFPTAQLDEINTELTKSIKIMKRIKVGQDGLKDNLDESKTVCKQEIQKYREDINLIIDQIEATTLAELDSIYKDVKNITEDSDLSIQHIKDEMVRFKSEIESDRSNDSQKFVIAKLSRSMIKRGRDLESELLMPNDQTTEMTFTRNTDIMTFLLSIVTLGILSPRWKSAPSLSSATLDSKQSRLMKTNTVQSTYLKVKTQCPTKQGLNKKITISEYNIRHQDDTKTCNILSCCVLDDRKILLADIGNKKLKLVDNRKFTIKSSLALGARPLSVCGVSTTEAAVCLSDNTIQFVSTSDELQQIRLLNMKHYCSCIGVYRGMMYVCSRQSVYIYELDGELVNILTYNPSEISNICDITMSDDEKTIHVADPKNGVFTLNIDGKVVWRYLDKKLICAQGLCTDDNDHVIVCAKWSHNVVQLGQDGQYLGEIVPNTVLYSPQTVCFDRHNQNLIIGKACDDSITVATIR